MALMQEITEVVAAVIRRRKSILICQRRADQPHPLKWEFPGGKVEPGESAPAALRRELEEELGIEAQIGAEIEQYRFSYPRRRPILLIFYEVIEFRGKPSNRCFSEIRWAAPHELAQFDFLEGDLEFVRRLATASANPRPGSDSSAPSNPGPPA